jgi:hypothetical protein
VAVGTTGELVHSFQEKVIMGEYCSFPAPNMNMANAALGRKSGSYVIRIPGSLKFFTVATITIDHRLNEVLIFMALDTVQSPVHAFQPVSGNVQVIPFIRFDILPGEGIMAVFAVTAQFK